MNLSLLRRIAAVAVVAWSAAAPAAAYSNVVVFGDSLSDSGNNAIRLGTDPNQVITGNGYVPTRPYGSGTYSNGDVWATSFAAGLGLAALPSLAGGTDYAYGGAETRGRGFPPSLRTQVNTYAGTAPADAADTLFVIAGGGNNALGTLERIAGGASATRTLKQATSRYVSDVVLMVDQLQALGAQRIVVWNTPDIGLAPATLANGGADAAQLGTLISSTFNSSLASALAGETGVTLFDVFGLVHTVVANPGAYGLANVTDACGAIVGCNPSTYLFWDGEHPTSAGHAIIANALLGTQMALASPVPEPETLWLMGAGVVVLLARRRRAAQ